MNIKNYKPEEGSPHYKIFRLWRLLDLTRFLIARLREQELARFNITPEQASEETLKALALTPVSTGGTGSS